MRLQDLIGDGLLKEKENCRNSKLTGKRCIAMLFLCRVMKIRSSVSIARRDTKVTRDLFWILCHVCVTSKSIRRKPNLFVYYLKHPPYVIHIVYMVVHVQINSLDLENCNIQHMIILLWNVYNKVMKCAFGKRVCTSQTHVLRFSYFFFFLSRNI